MCDICVCLLLTQTKKMEKEAEKGDRAFTSQNLDYWFEQQFMMCTFHTICFLKAISQLHSNL